VRTEVVPLEARLYKINIIKNNKQFIN